jgi:glycosyltransferase involved in cell wall biosynthesis
MNLLVLNYEYPPIGGGGGVVSQGLAEALVKIGYRIDLVTSGMRGLPNFEVVHGVRIHRVKCIRRFRHYVTLPEMMTLMVPLYLKALKLVRQNNYQINHTHFIFPSGLISYWIKRQTGLPYILTCHGSDVPGYNPDRFNLSHQLLKSIWRKTIENSQGVTSPSAFLRELIHDRIDLPVSVIPNGHNLTCHLNGNKKNRILVVSRLFERKGVQFFLQAVAELKTNWEVLIAGDGPYLSTLKNIARNNPAIQFLGFVKGRALADLYQSAKIFVFPSIQENFPMVLLEAMAAGCAIITTDAPGCCEVVGQAALKTCCGSVNDLREALVKLMNNEDQIRELGCQSIRRATQLSWSNMAGQFDGLIRKCLCQPRV